MKIVHVIESGGGSSEFVFYLIRYLPQHHHTIVYGERTFALRFEEVEKTYPLVTFIKWEHVQREVKLWMDLKAAYSLYTILNKVPSDIIHLHSSKAGFIGRMICFLQRKKYSLYTPNGLTYLRTDISLLKTKFFVFLERFADFFNGNIIACSKSEADELRKKGMKAQYINNGTVVGEIPPLKNSGEKLIIATSGRATIQKNPELFNAIASHFVSNTGISFVWIGDGELKDLLTSSNIKITGWVDKAEVLRTINSSDIYISTALWEGLPFAVIEAMSLGKPLLLTSCVGNIDLVLPGRNGFTYSTAQEAIEKIVFFEKNRSVLPEFGLSSFQIVRETFEVTKMAQEYDKVYLQFKRKK